MLRRREASSLIELLLVFVVIGILAAIAVPKVAGAREEAYFSVMKSDLKSLKAAQEIHHSDPANDFNYSARLADLEFTVSSGVTITPVASNPRAGWGATASHAHLLPSQICGVYVGSGSAGDPATGPGVVTCSGEGLEPQTPERERARRSRARRPGSRGSQNSRRGQ